MFSLYVCYLFARGRAVRTVRISPWPICQKGELLMLSVGETIQAVDIFEKCLKTIILADTSLVREIG